MTKPLYCDGEKLKARVKSGDQNLLEDLFQCFQTELSRHLMGRCKNKQDAEDSLQDVFEIVANNIDLYRGDSPLAHWLFKIASNVCFRKKRGMKNNPYLHESIEASNISLQADSGQIEDVVAIKMLPLRKAFAEINEIDRMVLIMKDGQGMTNQEICKKLNLTLPAVKSKLLRAREKMKKILED